MLVSGSFCSIKNLLIAALVTKEQHAVVGLLGVYTACSPLERQRGLIGCVFLEDAIKQVNQLVSASNNGGSLQNGREKPKIWFIKSYSIQGCKKETECRIYEEGVHSQKEILRILEGHHHFVYLVRQCLQKGGLQTHMQTIK